MRIRAIETILVDLPTIRAHRLANQTVTTQTLVVLRVRTDEGLEGLGEATTIGGLSYGAEAPETIKVVIDTYCAPLLLDRDPTPPGVLMADLDRRVKGNRLAKSAIETALLDIAAKRLGVPLATLFGGARTDALEVAWGLASGEAGHDIDEAERALASERHRIFKIKVGADDAERDIERVLRVVAAVGARGRVRVDANGAWDEPTARRAIAGLEAAGVELVEQPVAPADSAALTRLSRRCSVPLMADESVATPADAFALARARACDVFALKIAKAGGLRETAKVAAIAEAAGIGLYGGTMLEGTIGTLASAHLFAALPPLAWGTELFGPLLLTDDIVVERPAYSDFAIRVPVGPGLGAAIDEEKLGFYRRDRSARAVAMPRTQAAA